jgi:hypothetical protein
MVEDEGEDVVSLRKEAAEAEAEAIRLQARKDRSVSIIEIMSNMEIVQTSRIVNTAITSSTSTKSGNT